MPNEFWGDIPTWLGVGVALWTIVRGLREYTTAQDWKRAEFLASEVDRFFSTRGVATALLLIDYSRIRLAPDGTRARRDDARAHTYTDLSIISALRVHTDFADETEQFDEHEMLVRQAFDDLLTGLERFAHHVEVQLISADDLKTYLAYWLEKLASEQTKWKP